MSIGENIERLRKAKSLTQAKLAEKLDVSFQAVSNWENDTYYPDTDNILKLCDALDTDPTHILWDNYDFNKKDRFFNEDHMHTYIKSQAVANNLNQTLQVLDYAKEKHETCSKTPYLKHKEGVKVPYINHPYTLCCNALALGIKEDNITSACLLHDVCEDCGVKVDELPVNEETKKIVCLLTKKKEHGKKFNEKNYYEAISLCPKAAFVKLLDRCCNISNMARGFNRDKIKQYVDETEKYILPLLTVIKKENAVMNDAAWILSYHMQGILETVKWLL